MIAFSTGEFGSRLSQGRLEGLNRFGASSRISSFVLPLGYSFNLDGTMMYCTFCKYLHRARTYHIEMSLGTQLAMLATLMITSKGVAGVPPRFAGRDRLDLEPVRHSGGGPVDDHGPSILFLDMGRSATNVIGNSLATAVVAKWEGEPRARARAWPRRHRAAGYGPRRGAGKCRPATHRR